jgi:hypothetical protein
MYCYLLQDWTTIQGDATLLAFTQAENDWFDAAGFQDVVTWLEVKEGFFSIGGLTMAYQTAPTKDEALFATMGTVNFAYNPGVTTTVMLKDTALVPIARWLRWQIQASSSTSWNLTFRILCALNAIGSNRPNIAQP